MQKYGQHFLVNDSIITQITDAACLLHTTHQTQQTVEIGPGKGALTQGLLLRPLSPLTLVEIDPEMAAYLQMHVLPKNGNVPLRVQNFLKSDWQTFLQVPTLFVSNLPYIDAADILDKVLGWKYFAAAVFMFQKEQAQRICAKAGDPFYGPISVFTSLRARASLLCNVGKGCFNPPPKVESRVLVFERKKCPVEDWKRLVRVVQGAFAHKRKTVFNSLVLSGFDKARVEESLRISKIAPNERAEKIPPEKYVQLSMLL